MVSDVVVLVLMAYGFAALLVAWVNRISLHPIAQPNDTFTHYQVLVYNSANVLEGIIRRLLFRSMVEGRPVQISLVDYGSSDDTLHITRLFTQHYEIVLESSDQIACAHTIQIDLRNR